MDIKDLKVGDVICRDGHNDRTIMCVGDRRYFYSDRNSECSDFKSSVANWKIKQPEPEVKKLYAYRSCKDVVFKNDDFYKNSLESGVRFKRAPEYDIVYPVEG